MIMLLCGHCLLAQQVIPMNGHKGVLFADTVGLVFDIDSAASRFTPSKEEALLADEIIFENKEYYVKIFGKSVKKEIKKSYRQFVGYCDLKGDKHVIVFLLNMNRRDSKYHFNDWQTKPTIGFGGFFERNLKVLDVNLNQRKATVYGM